MEGILLMTLELSIVLPILRNAVLGKRKRVLMSEKIEGRNQLLGVLMEGHSWRELTIRCEDGGACLLNEVQILGVAVEVVVLVLLVDHRKLLLLQSGGRRRERVVGVQHEWVRVVWHSSIRRLELLLF